MKKSKRFALLLAVLLVAALVFSSLCLAAESEHDCSGEHCHVCALLAVCRHTLRLLASALSVAASFLTAAGVFVDSALRTRRDGNAPTPVVLKVKLSN